MHTALPSETIETVFEFGYGLRMPELAPIPFARMNLEQVRERLLAAAAFGETLSPDQLEALARKVTAGLRIYIQATQNGARPASLREVPSGGRACLDYHGRTR